MFSRQLRLRLATSILCLLVLYFFYTRFLALTPVDKISNFVPQRNDHDVPLALAPKGTSASQFEYESFAPEKLPASTHSESRSIAVPTSAPSSQLPVASISPQDVLLIIKTGASTAWRRMPLHLTTTLVNPRIANSVVYSDLDEQLSKDIFAIDVLVNDSSIIQTFDPATYAIYVDQKSPSHINTYLENAQLPGDEPPGQGTSGISPGWLLDKYKFLPMLGHAQKNWPDLKWYIYIEDDTFIFMNTLLRWLSNISPDSSPAYYGAHSGESNATFAQGGSGIVFSRSLMRSIFSGSQSPIPYLEKYANVTSKSCCGDMILGQVLREYGVNVNEGAYGTMSFRPEPPWKTRFDGVMWCEEVFSFHHLHGRDLVVLSEMERRFERAGRPILFKDVFTELINPQVQQLIRTGWDNMASRYIISDNSSLAALSAELSPSQFIVAKDSPELCQKACAAMPECMSWRHENATENKCGLDTVVRLGRETDPPPPFWKKERVEITSGWMLDRIEVLMVNECKGL